MKKNKELERNEERAEDVIIFEDLVERPRSEYSMTVYKNLHVVYDYEKDADVINIKRKCTPEEKEFFENVNNEFENISKLDKNLSVLLSESNENSVEQEKLIKSIRKVVLEYLTFSERCYNFLLTCGDDNVLMAEKLAEKNIVAKEIKNEYLFNVYKLLEKLKVSVVIAKKIYKVANDRNIQLYPNPTDLLNGTSKLPYLFVDEPFEVYYDIEVFKDFDPEDEMYFRAEAFYRSNIQNDKYHARDEQLIDFMNELEEISKNYYSKHQ